MRCSAVPRRARGRGWGGVRLWCCAGRSRCGAVAVRGGRGAGRSRCGVGLKGAVGSVPPGRRSREPAERESASRSPDPSVGRCGETQRNARTVLPDKHRSGRCLQRATARWRLARRGLSRQAESEERSEGPASPPSGTTAVAARTRPSGGAERRNGTPGPSCQISTAAGGVSSALPHAGGSRDAVCLAKRRARSAARVPRACRARVSKSQPGPVRRAVPRDATERPDRLPEPGAVEPTGAFWVLLSRSAGSATDPDQ